MLDPFDPIDPLDPLDPLETTIGRSAVDEVLLDVDAGRFVGGVALPTSSISSTSRTRMASTFARDMLSSGLFDSSYDDSFDQSFAVSFDPDLFEAVRPFWRSPAVSTMKQSVIFGSASTRHTDSDKPWDKPAMRATASCCAPATRARAKTERTTDAPAACRG